MKRLLLLLLSAKHSPFNTFPCKQLSEQNNLNNLLICFRLVEV